MHSGIRSLSARVVLGWLLLSCTVQADAQVTVKFNLPSQSLAESLRAVASQTQTNILFDRVLVHGLMAQALDAQLNLDQAMRRLLAGTGLTYRKTDEKTVVIVVADKAGDPSTTHDTASPSSPAQTQHLASTAGLTANGIEAQSSMAKDSDATRLEEITVTARRREESLYAVPVAVTALSPSDIRARGIQTAEDLQNYVPSLNVSSSVTRDDYTFSLRGMGPTGGSGPGAVLAGGGTGVVTYFADVPTSGAGPGTFYDLESAGRGRPSRHALRKKHHGRCCLVRAEEARE